MRMIWEGFGMHAYGQIEAGSSACKFWHNGGMCRCNYFELTSYAGGRGVGSAPSGEREGRSPLASMRQCDSQREAAPVYRSKDIKVSTQVVIRDLFCKRRRAMLQYGTPDWARPCLARLTPWGFCVGTAGSETHRSRSPPDARTAPTRCTLLSIRFRYLQKGARATKLNGQCRPTIISYPLSILRSDL